MNPTPNGCTCDDVRSLAARAGEPKDADWQCICGREHCFGVLENGDVYVRLVPKPRKRGRVRT